MAIKSKRIKCMCSHDGIFYANKNERTIATCAMTWMNVKNKMLGKGNQT